MYKKKFDEEIKLKLFIIGNFQENPAACGGDELVK